MKRKLEASYTVEAAFIIPVVFALLCGIVFLAFRLHDITVLRQTIWEGAFYGAGQLETPSKKEIADYVEERLEDNLLISEESVVSVVQEKTGVSVRITGKSNTLQFVEGILGIKQNRKLQVQHTVEYPSAGRYVRNGLIISSKIKGLWKRNEEEKG